MVARWLGTICPIFLQNIDSILGSPALPGDISPSSSFSGIKADVESIIQTQPSFSFALTSLTAMSKKASALNGSSSEWMIFILSLLRPSTPRRFISFNRPSASRYIIGRPSFWQFAAICNAVVVFPHLGSPVRITQEPSLIPPPRERSTDGLTVIIL